MLCQHWKCPRLAKLTKKMRTLAKTSYLIHPAREARDPAGIGRWLAMGRRSSRVSLPAGRSNFGRLATSARFSWITLDSVKAEPGILCAEITGWELALFSAVSAEQCTTPRSEARNAEVRERRRIECSKCSVSIGNVRDSLNRREDVYSSPRLSYPSGTGRTQSNRDLPLACDGPSVKPSFAASRAKQLRPACSHCPTSWITFDSVKAERY